MPGLEAIMLCADNSEWMRNGDYSPSRMEAQSEAIQYLASTKINSNPENSVGLLSMAGNRIEVHVSPCRSVGSIMNAMAHKIKVAGVSNLVGALKTAQLALKNRPNKNARQRIIVFVGSPIGSSVEELEKLGKLFKKNNVSIDAVNFGAENASNDNAEKLEALISATNANDSSHLVNIPPGPHNLSDLVLSSSIVVDPSVAAGGGGVGGVGIPGMEGDVDPELAMAIRMSMEEERARQAASSATAAPATGGLTDQGAVPTNPSLPVVTDNMDEDEEAQLARAIALSMAAEHGAADASSAPEPHPDVMVTESLPATSASSASSSSATAASSTAGATSTSSAASSADIDISAAMEDPDFINSLLASVPGAEGQQGIDNLLDQLSGAPKDDKDKDKDKDKTK